MFNSLTRSERRLGLALAGVVASRMLGLFLVLPVLVVLAADLNGYTPAVAGLALGVYGLGQALLQQRFGRWSDRWGRRRLILIGLALFVAGSVLAALASHIWVLVAARAVQGCGAVAGVTLAFAADRTHPERRSTVMAIIGMGIGAAFLLSIMISVPLATWLGLSGLFWLTAGLGMVGMLLVPAEVVTRPTESDLRQPGSTNDDIRWLCGSVFLLHASMTTLFVVMPGLLVQDYGQPLALHWRLYVPTMALAVLLVFPLLWWIARKHAEQRAIPWAFALLSAPLALFSAGPALPALAIGLMVYFLAFSLLEAVMPSQVSHSIGPTGRGRLMGRYTTWQFLGAFAGGALGGTVLQSVGAEAALLAVALISIAWAWVARTAFQVVQGGK